MSTIPGGPEDVVSPATASPAPEPAPTKSLGKAIVVLAAIGAVVAVLLGAGLGRMTAVQQDVQPVAALAPVTMTATPSTVTKTVTSTPAPVTVTAEPSTVTAPPATVTETQTATVTEQAETVTAGAPSGPAAGIKDGVSLVGTDVQPGTYRSDNDDCYWARLFGTSGSFENIVANSNGATVVTIDPSDNAFESRRCSPWTQVG